MTKKSRIPPSKLFTGLNIFSVTFLSGAAFFSSKLFSFLVLFCFSSFLLSAEDLFFKNVCLDFNVSRIEVTDVRIPATSDSNCGEYLPLSSTMTLVLGSAVGLALAGANCLTGLDCAVFLPAGAPLNADALILFFLTSNLPLSFFDFTLLNSSSKRSDSSDESLVLGILALTIASFNKVR